MKPTDEEEPASGLQGTDFAVAMFATMFMGTGAVLDTITSVKLGAASLVVTGLGLWLLFRWLRSGRPQVQRFVGAVVIVAVVLSARVLLKKVLLTGF
ncbi:hypothetical protein [Solirubrum puertoriconensis]|uniref:Uncharacterized protein n=1 Tax=Solirubrum puertoriconensis TaxID=1751427 RepID=A0A9X0HIR3_SOLP1|nr:hypothetical protein [Solirubrum puertoriconensis]KUG06602.1 hypothetical protein ASU33_04465 [Solirubrum puertoriconensis]